jgi:hypothetical protein
VTGGFLGALAGFIDVFLLGDCLNLRDSDNVAAWRENRSWVVIVNAAAVALVGAVLAGASRARRPVG